MYLTDGSFLSAGEYENGVMHGQGVFKYLGGWVYSGQWVKNNEEGIGTKTNPNGNVYHGEFANGEWAVVGRLVLVSLPHWDCMLVFSCTYSYRSVSY